MPTLFQHPLCTREGQKHREAGRVAGGPPSALPASASPGASSAWLHAPLQATPYLPGQVRPKDRWQLPGALRSGQRSAPKLSPLQHEGDGGEGGAGERVLPRMLTWGHGLHVSGELAAHVVVVGADVVETPVRQLVRTVELRTQRRASVLGPRGGVSLHGHGC